MTRVLVLLLLALSACAFDGATGAAAPPDADGPRLDACLDTQTVGEAQYLVSATAMIRSEAIAYCDARSGMTLSPIESLAEAAALRAVFQMKLWTAVAQLPGQLAVDTGWTTGSGQAVPADFPWAGNEPNDAGAIEDGGEDFASLHPDGLHDDGAARRFRALCKCDRSL